MDSRVSTLPPEVHYVPDFITKDEEAYLKQKIAASPRPKWKTADTGRSLGFNTGAARSYLRHLIQLKIQIGIPILSPNLVERITSVTEAFQVPSDGSAVGQPNQVLINEYQPSQGISVSLLLHYNLIRDVEIQALIIFDIKPHEDGPAYHPAVATISLGSPTLLAIYAYKELPMESLHPDVESVTPKGRAIQPDPVAHIFLEPRSLLIMTGDMYKNHLHGISPSESDVIIAKGREDVCGSTAVSVANEEWIADRSIRGFLADQGRYLAIRSVRTSLTFRRVEKTAKMGVGGMLGKTRSG
ncbi:hypothetical protein FRB98_004570 [Tulasnella sp. 332]|nr:hypothetical protein FRB98_004570 [Tulasnella sp. 332]